MAINDSLDKISSPGLAMTPETHTHVADEYARQFAGVLVDQSFGSGWTVYKLHGKVFMLITEVHGTPTVIVKADPIRAAVLRGKYVEVSPGYRMNKRHWIAIVAGKAITTSLLQQEINESYWLVHASLPLQPALGAAPDGRRVRSVSRRGLQPLARRVAAALPDVSHGRPFVEKLDVYKVVDKVFMIVTDDSNEPVITVKAVPEQVEALCKTYASITTGRYLDKRHWVSIEGGRGVTRELVVGLIERSYQLALNGVAKRAKPVDR
jgi:predicted DNA-binding protein (MmcQ/YjbR family)